MKGTEKKRHKHVVAWRMSKRLCGGGPIGGITRYSIVGVKNAWKRKGRVSTGPREGKKRIAPGWGKSGQGEIRYEKKRW